MKNQNLNTTSQLKTFLVMLLLTVILPSGIFAQIQAGKFSQVIRMVYLP